MKVNFVIVGAQKSGTTALSHFLRQHPEICFCREKEAHYFDREEYFRTGTPDYKIYHGFFDRDPQQHKVIGEVTPIYMYWEPCMKRIWEYNKNIKIIAILKNPIHRAYSGWRMEKLRNAENLSFPEATQNEVERCRENLPDRHRVYSYIDRGFYTEQVRRIFRFFPAQNCLFLKNEDLLNNHQKTLYEIFNFLGISKDVAIKPEIVFSNSSVVGSISKADFMYLKKIYYYEIKQLENMLNWSLESWFRYDPDFKTPSYLMPVVAATKFINKLK